MRVLITGASKGIGRAIALTLQHEYSLILHASSQASLLPLLGDLADPDKHNTLPADFSDAAAVKQFCGDLKKNYTDGLLAIINNAGITIDKSLLFQPEGDIDKMIEVNLKSPILVSKTAFKIFHAAGQGIIINISSCVGETGNAFQSVYAATKAGLVAFSKSLAREAGTLLPTHAVRVLTISPGYIETEMTGKIPEHERQRYLNNIPARRMGMPEEVAGLVKYLLTDEAAYINGSEIRINGGIV